MAILDRACARRLAVIRPGRKNAVQPNRKTSVAKHERSLLPTPNSEEAKDLNDNTGREITALIVLADAINRAGSTDEEKIRQALIATDVPGDQTIMPWKGIKFDNTGQNIAATPVIQQIKKGKYHTIYPFDVAAEEAVWNVGK